MGLKSGVSIPSATSTAIISFRKSGTRETLDPAALPDGASPDPLARGRDLSTSTRSPLSKARGRERGAARRAQSGGGSPQVACGRAGEGERERAFSLRICSLPRGEEGGICGGPKTPLGRHEAGYGTACPTSWEGGPQSVWYKPASHPWTVSWMTLKIMNMIIMIILILLLMILVILLVITIPSLDVDDPRPATAGLRKTCS